MKILFGKTALARGADYDEMPIDLKITGDRGIQVLSTIRGASARAINRGNLTTSIEFRVRKKHSTAEDAQQDAIEHASSIVTEPSQLTIITEPGNAIYWLNNAVISGIVSTSNGNISEHFYKIIGGNISESQG